MYPQAYIQYLLQFHCHRDYFECHEILEEHWKADPPKERKVYWVGLIQLAVSLYHQRRKNFNGAERMMKKAVAILTQHKEAMEQLGLDYTLLSQELTTRLQQIQDKKLYTSINLPIKDSALLALCAKLCTSNGLVWGQKSDMANNDLIHKHSHRDRSDVINERLRQIKLRKETL
ncbi:DUF309 domain-containing protein [Bacillus sp. 165]|uniref:DUF309 domain-containing protein n=1 Tax=Bacillus sp. 165 TaxID=1529117 RepID=UPI001AD9C689|nr:DUF309 domain-containing protein [Bacillus sp. 165]MBO9129832.1 DUF309 domain-containing protein [Bacillus sp. 165]